MRNRHVDIMRWTPDRRYQLIFFGFWLSHVPTARMASFFGTLRRSLTPSGQVIFVDEHVSQAPKERRAPILRSWSGPCRTAPCIAWSRSSSTRHGSALAWVPWAGTAS
jgi:hypothetical protein